MPKNEKEILSPIGRQFVAGLLLEPDLQNTPLGETIQFERLGYYCVDKDTSSSHFIFNQTIELRDSWEKKKGNSNA